jgi:hypothetical protein
MAAASPDAPFTECAHLTLVLDRVEAVGTRPGAALVEATLRVGLTEGRPQQANQPADQRPSDHEVR